MNKRKVEKMRELPRGDNSFRLLGFLRTLPEGRPEFMTEASKKDSGDTWEKIQIFEPGEKIFEFFVDKGLTGI